MIFEYDTHKAFDVYIDGNARIKVGQIYREFDKEWVFAPN